MKIGPRITIFLNISNLSKKLLDGFSFYSVSNFGPGMVQLKYQRAKRLKFFFLDAQSTLGMRHVSFKVQNLSIFKVLNLRKENFNRLAL